MKILIELLRRIAIALEDLVEVGRYRNEMLEEDIKNEKQFKDAYINNMNQATEKLAASLENE